MKDQKQMRTLFTAALFATTYLVATAPVRADESAGTTIKNTTEDAKTDTKKAVRKMKRSARKINGTDTKMKDTKDKINDVKDDAHGGLKKTKNKASDLTN